MTYEGRDCGFRCQRQCSSKIDGIKPDHIMAKDIILKIIGDIGTDGANYKAMQFAGSIMKDLPMEERLQLLPI